MLKLTWGQNVPLYKDDYVSSFKIWSSLILIIESGTSESNSNNQVPSDHNDHYKVQVQGVGSIWYQKRIWLEFMYRDSYAYIMLTE